MVNTSKSLGGSQSHTFGFADLAGFTALTEAHGDQQAADLALDFASRAEAWLDSVGGGDLKLVGDAAMVRCTEASAAVELALQIVEELPSLGGYPAVRVGLNTGPAAERNGDWFGAAVNLAARVAGLAEGGEVLVTRSTQRAAAALSDVKWEDLGEQRFRNVRDPVVVLRVRRSEARPSSAVMDPVCRMYLEPDRAFDKARHRGRSYFFCSESCADAFAADPETYV